MKPAIFFLFLFLVTSVFAQERLTIFYFGASNCGPCNRKEVVESINKMKKDFNTIHKEYDTKFVMVCMDNNIDEGLKFISKYDHWDEITIGRFYDSEPALDVLNKTNIPGVPHIVIYRDSLDIGNKQENLKLIKNRKLVKEITGGTDIVKWVSEGLRLE